MANRIYIAIGLIAILLLGAAFVVPWFIDWNGYKDRMEQMASQALGAEVSITGNMDFELLPRPRLHMESVRIGSAVNPIGEAVLVEADFSLFDFLRDRFTVTQLRLIQPQINLNIGPDGQIETPIQLAETATAANVSIANARFEDGAIRLFDQRNGGNWQATGFTGEMRLSALRGPFTLQARADVMGVPHELRFSTSAMNTAGQMQVTAYARPADGRFAMTVEGLLSTGLAPGIEGKVAYRQPPPAGSDDAVGALLIESPLMANPERILLTGFVLLPDENQAATRLTGDATVVLGAEPRFDIGLTTGVATLAAPPAGEQQDARPIWATLPIPPVPPIPGRLGIAISELSLGGRSVRELRLDASTNGSQWTVETLQGRLAGDTALRFNGTVGVQNGAPAIQGNLSLQSQRLDALSVLWRRPESDNPLFNRGGSLDATVLLRRNEIRLDEGVFTLDGTSHDFTARVELGDAQRLVLDASLGALSSSQSAALLALLPNQGGWPGGLFGAGTFDITAEAGTLFAHRFSDLEAHGRWDGGVVGFDLFRVADLGGLSFDGQLELRPSETGPQLSGRGALVVAAHAPVVNALIPNTAELAPLRRALIGSLPANVDIAIDPPVSGTMQSLSIEGRMGAADVRLDAEFEKGLGQFADGRFSLGLEAVADSAAELLDQVGLFPLIEGTDGAMLTVSASGNPRGAVDAEITLEGGGEKVEFIGGLNLADLGAIGGQGRSSFMLADGYALAELAGARGVWFPGVEGRAEIAFSGRDSVTLTGIEAFAGERTLRGDLTFARQRDSALVSGALAFDALDIETVAAMLAGPASLIDSGSGVWPDGPLDIGAAPRTSRGRVAITSPDLRLDDEPVMEVATFDFSWDEREVRVRNLFAEIGGGTMQAEVALCCAADFVDKTLSGRMTLNGVRIGTLLPEAPAGALSGTLNAGGQFQATGDSFQSLMAALGGDGSFSVGDLRIANLSPSVFATTAEVENLATLDPDALVAVAGTALDSGPFVADEAGGVFTLVNGNIRLSNLAIEGRGARLLGGGEFGLDTLAMDASWVLALTEPVSGNGLITETTGRIGLDVAGTLYAPERELDLSQMVAAIQMRAYEIELDELERLRAEQEARQRALAEEQARLMEEQARRQAELLLQQEQEIARILAEEEAARVAAEEEAARIAAEEAAARQAQPPTAPSVPAPAVQTLPPLVPQAPSSSIFDLPLTLPQPPQGL